MNNKKLVERLYRIGKLPTGEIADNIEFPLKEFDKILQKFKLPIDFDTALKLINLSPPVDESCYEVEWGIIHLVENYKDTDENFKKLLDMADDGEVKHMLKIRFENYLKDKNI